jgi:hypothetical protein
VHVLRDARRSVQGDRGPDRVDILLRDVEMDVLGLSYAEYSDAEREAVVHAHPRTAHFKEDIIQAFYDGIKHKPETTFGNVKAVCSRIRIRTSPAAISAASSADPLGAGKARYPCDRKSKH